MKFDQASVRKRFHEASAERGGLMQKLHPIHAQHKDLTKQIQALEAQAKELGDQMQPIRARLADLENEIAACSRFCRDEEGKSRMGLIEEILTEDEQRAAIQRGLAD